MPNENDKKLIRWVIAFGILACLLVMYKCIDKVNSQYIGIDKPNHDTLYKSEQKDNAIINQVLNEKYLLKLKYDSLLAKKPIYVIRYKTKFDSLYITDTSCQSSLIMLYNSFGELNDLNDSIIAAGQKKSIKDSVLIETLFHKIETKQQRATIDSCYIVRLQDSIPKVKRKGFWRGFKYGFGSGVIITEGANLYLKFKP